MNTRLHRLIAPLVLAAASALALTACDGGGAPAPTNADGTTTLKVATIGLVSDGALELGIEQGFFSDEHLTIETSVVANPPAGLAAAQSGQVDIAYSPSIPFLNALSQGIQLKVLQAADGYADGAASAPDPAEIDDSGLFASPASGITSVAELAGRTIAVPARKAQIEVTVTSALTEAGVDPASVNWIVLDFASAVAALKSGEVDAAGLVSPFVGQAAADGDPLIASPGVQFFQQGAIGLWTTGTSTLEANPDALAAFRRAITKSNEYANAHPQEAIQAGISYTGSSLTPEQVKTPYWPTTVREEDLERVNGKLVELGFLPSPVSLDGAIVAS